MPALTACLLAASAAWLLACSAPVERGAPTFHGEIVPLLERSCLPCHGEDSPHHPLASYADFSQHAERALSLVRAGIMPMGNVDRSGACGEFIAPERIGDAEIELLERFIDAGMPEGEPVDAPRLDDDDAAIAAVASELVASEPYLPATDADGGSGDHRCFLLAPGDSAAGPALRGFRVRPESPELVHHVMLFVLDTELDARAARALDQRSPGAGWPCFGTSGVAAARLVGVWTPGREAVRFPRGYATRLGGAGLVAQVHYDGPAPLAPSRVALELERGDGSARELRFLPFAAVELELPPGVESVVTSRRGVLGLDPGSEVLGVYPHMHALGKRLSLHGRLDAEAGAAPTCLVDVPRWDYTFQELALYRAPLAVTARDPELAIECEHGTLGQQRVVRWGERMEDEMCMAFVLAAPR